MGRRAVTWASVADFRFGSCVTSAPSRILAALNCTRDEGGPFEFGNQVLISSHRKLDSIDWELLLKAVRQHTDCPWVLLYVERWLKAPVQMEDGSVVPRTAGTPQGGVISPLLANLFLHYAFDTWMARNYPHSPFERYADDAICHCQSAKEARALWSWCCIR